MHVDGVFSVFYSNLQSLCGLVLVMTLASVDCWVFQALLLEKIMFFSTGFFIIREWKWFLWAFENDKKYYKQ